MELILFDTSKAFSGFAVNDIPKATEFYAGTLGMKVKQGEMGTLSIEISGGSEIIVYPKPNHVPAEFTILNFPVSNIDEAVEELNAKRVEFLQYNNESIKTDSKGVMRGNGPNIAWFKDPAGNILSILETEIL